MAIWWQSELQIAPRLVSEISWTQWSSLGSMNRPSLRIGLWFVVTQFLLNQNTVSGWLPRWSSLHFTTLYEVQNMFCLSNVAFPISKQVLRGCLRTIQSLSVRSAQWWLSHPLLETKDLKPVAESNNQVASAGQMHLQQMCALSLCISNSYLNDVKNQRKAEKKSNLDRFQTQSTYSIFLAACMFTCFLSYFLICIDLQCTYFPFGWASEVLHHLETHPKSWDVYSAWKTYKKLVNMAIEIVDLPSYKMVDLSIVM